MTRLIDKWIENMDTQMDIYNLDLKRKIGMDLCELTVKCCGISKEKINQAKKTTKISVVPITQGEGVISRFSESVAAIIKSMGFDNVDVTEHTDVNGVYDAVKSHADVIFFADDDRYLGLNIKNGKYGDNNYATALGFIIVLEELMKKNGRNIKNEKILQIGYGIVGKEAYKILSEKNINFAIYDKASEKIKDLNSGKIYNEKEIKEFRNILDFTNNGGWLKKEMISKDTIVSTPGIPLSLDQAAEDMVKDNLVADLLEIGTAVMLGLAIS